MIEGVKRKNKWHVAFYLFFVLRRLIIVLIFVSLEHLPGIQVMMIAYVNQLQLMYQGYHSPLISVFKNRIEVMNEMLVVVCETYLFIYSDWVGDKDVQTDMSTTNIGFICLLLGLNMTIVLW